MYKDEFSDYSFGKRSVKLRSLKKKKRNYI